MANCSTIEDCVSCVEGMCVWGEHVGVLLGTCSQYMTSFSGMMERVLEYGDQDRCPQQDKGSTEEAVTQASDNRSQEGCAHILGLSVGILFVGVLGALCFSLRGRIRPKMEAVIASFTGPSRPRRVDPSLCPLDA